MKNPKVLNIRDLKGKTSGIYVGRNTVWGNPYIMDNEDDRDRVCSDFYKYAVKRLKIEPNWLKLLKGKNLICHCVPKKCHADILLKLSNIKSRR